ncbi:MAG TPA: sigma-70 family RNA polymerase sigma factor [Chloroflexota bacterium]|nr:sigma-70 family RNA polymerase sigma factor [Chloroflexota bacterium]
MLRVAETLPLPDGDRPRADADLVSASQADPTAFGALYERYRDRVFWYLLTRTDTAVDAEDLLQIVFLKALDALAQYRPEKGPFSAWLFGIARNTAATFHARRLPTVAWDLVPEILLPVDEHDLEARLLRQEDLSRLRLLFGRLDARKRELLVLRFVAGLTSAEIACMVGKSEAATKKQLARILHTLKEHYHDHA